MNSGAQSFRYPFWGSTTNPKDPATTKVGVLDVCPIIGLGNNNQTKKVVTLPTEKVDIK